MRVRVAGATTSTTERTAIGLTTALPRWRMESLFDDKDFKEEHRDQKTSREEEKMPKLTARTTSQRLAAVITACAVIAGLAPTSVIAPAQAAPLYPTAAPAPGNTLVEVRGFAAHGGAVHAGPRGGAVVRSGAMVRGPTRGAAVRRTTVVGPRGNVAVRTGVVTRGAWARPGRYRWPRGGAIAAGAALGFVAAATAVAWAGAPPADGLCWYYTDPSRTRGFWDYCP